MTTSRLPNLFRSLSSLVKNKTEQIQFEPVFSFPFVKNIALVNRLKIYHMFGSCVVIPSSGLMEVFNILPENSFITASYIGVTAAAVLSLFTLPFRNIIGHLYISEDNKLIKISSVSFSGKRVDRIVTVDEWIPILNMKPSKMDILYLRPELTDGTKYKLFINFGVVKNSTKMGQVLE